MSFVNTPERFSGKRNSMRHLINIVESVEDDINMDRLADRACHMLMHHVYDHRKSDFEVEFRNNDKLDAYLCFRPETIGYDKEFGIDDLLVCIGKKDRRARGYSGMHAKFGKTVLGRYTHAIIINCLSALDDDNLVTSVNSTLFIPVFKHEFIHAFDGLRTKEKIFGQGDMDGRDKAKYYNSSSEFNAYYHNVAHHILKLITDIRDHQYSADEARELADFYGVTEDFSQTLKNGISADTHLREFIKWLTNDRRKSLLKRLYKAHQVLVGLMRTGARGATPAS